MMKGLDKTKMAAATDQTNLDQTVTHAQNFTNKKSLIVTIYAAENTPNLGNTLQHYALQEAIKSLGCEAKSLLCPEKVATDTTGNIRKIIRSIKGILKIILVTVGLYHSYIKPLPEHTEKRKEIFARFYSEFIDGIIRSSFSEVMSAGKSYTSGIDTVIVGSDQVWNKNIVQDFEILRYFYLTWAEKEKRACYAPSYGDQEIQSCDYGVHRKGLEGFSLLSCREKSGCDFIRKITGREAELVLDPTLLLTAEQWRKISRKPECDVPEHYVLRYCWEGNTWFDEQHELAGGRKIIDVFDPSREYYRNVGPREFIWLIDHADLVFSESFHGTAFAVNLGKNFLSFMKTRNDSGRIGTLLSAIGLESHIYEAGMKSVPDDINHADVEAKLESLRESSMKYLRECLKVQG